MRNNISNVRHVIRFLNEKLTEHEKIAAIGRTILMVKISTLKFLINDLFVYSGHFVIQKGRDDIVCLF